MSGSAKKILVIRFSSIGDIVLTSPVVRVLKEQLKAEIHFLTKAVYADILRANPNIDHVFAIKKKLTEVLPTLQANAYDYVIDLHKNLRSLQVKFKLSAATASFEKLNFEKWLLTNLKINKLPEVHIVDRYLKTIAFLGVQNDGKGLDYFIPPEEEVSIEPLIGHSKPYLAFAIGAAHATKRLTPTQIRKICQGLDIPMVLLGGPGDQSIGEVAARDLPQVVNQCGQLTIHQSASVLRQAQLVLTHDTGMMHIAAAFQKPILSVWGNTVPAFGMYPYYEKGIDQKETFEVEGLSCRPCSKIGYANCPKGHFKCMEDQDLAEIQKRILIRFKG